MQGGTAQILTPLITVAILALVLWRRNSRPRRLRIELLWIRPVLFALIISATLSATPFPFNPLSLAVMALALAVGAAMGWQRGRFMHIDVHPETHDVTSRVSPVGMIFIVAVLALRLLLRNAALESRFALGIPAAAITDGLILLLGAMIVAQSLEMWLRARRLLEEARAAKAASETPAAQPPLVT
jgi:amino acid transporter